MKIEAVTVSIHFSDYLIHCVGNKKHFDRWIIVTVEDDHETIDICKKHDIEYVLSKDIYTGRHGEPAIFAKGRAVNEGLAVLDRDDWLVHMDSDVILPKDTRRVIRKGKLDTEKLYCPRGRYMAYSVSDLSRDLKDLPFRRRTKNPNEREEDRWMGFFQLWHSSIRQEYRAKSGNARKDDVGFRRKWKLHNRGVLKFSCVHLGPRRENWEGRTSPKFS